MSQGQLDDYLWELNGKRRLYLGKKKGKTLVQHIKSLVFDKNGFEIYDFDPAKDMLRVYELI